MRKSSLLGEMFEWLYMYIIIHVQEVRRGVRELFQSTVLGLGLGYVPLAQVGKFSTKNVFFSKCKLYVPKFSAPQAHRFYNKNFHIKMIRKVQNLCYALKFYTEFLQNIFKKFGKQHFLLFAFVHYGFKPGEHKLFGQQTVTKHAYSYEHSSYLLF